AGSATALLLVGWIGLYHMGFPVWVPWEQPDPARADKTKAAVDAEPQRRSIEAELQRLKEAVERQAQAAADADAKRMAAEAEQQRMREEAQRQAKAAADAEASRRAAEAEQQRLAAVKAEEERKAKAAAEAEARAKAEQVEKERLARASPSSCSNPNALGVARVVEIDTTGGPGFGFEHFKAHDFLREGEVVLTFDDGPWPKNTPAVLAALQAHCTKAIF